MLNNSQESRFDREVDNSGYETVRIGLDLFTKFLNSVSGILALALWLQIFEGGGIDISGDRWAWASRMSPKYRDDESTSIIRDRATNQWDQSNLLDISER